MQFKKDFPLLTNHPQTIYLDSAATTQKPSYVINGVKHFLEHDYANIHRGWYDLSLASEELFRQARKKVATWINARDDEIIFRANSTDASNVLIQSLVLSGVIKPGNKIITTITAHHASFVPRQLVAKFMDIEIIFVGVDENGFLDIEEFIQKYDEHVRVVSLPFVSNVMWQVDDMQQIKKIIRDDTLYIIDASQAIAHVPVNVQELGCDYLFFTGHKIFAFTGIGVLWGKWAHLKELQPSIAGGGAIDSVTSSGYTLLEAPDKFEPGTPNLVWAVSLLKALEYMEHVAQEVWMTSYYDALIQIEHPLIDYAIEQFAHLESKGVKLLGTKDPKSKIGLFSFLLPEGKNPTLLGQYMAKENTCIRCGGQCAQPLHELLGKQGSCRISFSIYTTRSEVERFFDLLQKFLEM